MKTKIQNTLLTALLTLCLLLLTNSKSWAQDPTQTDNLDQVLSEQSGTAIHIVFDDSGSMSGTKLSQAKSAFNTWLNDIPEGTKLALRALNAGQLVPLGSGNTKNRDDVKAAVNDLQATGGTPLTRTFVDVARGIQSRRDSVTPYERHIIILFTDGEDSEFHASDVQNSIRGVTAMNVETVGIGFHGQGDYLAQATGKYFNASDEDQLVSALETVASEIDQQVDVVISPKVQAILDRGPSPAETTFPSQASVPAVPEGNSISFGVILVCIMGGLFAIILIGKLLS